MTESAAKAPDGGDAELQQPLGDGACVHDVRSDDEQRHREQDEAVVEALQDLLAGERDVLAGDRQVDERAEDDGVGNGRTDRRQPEQDQQAQRQAEAHPSSPTWTSCASSGGPLRITWTKTQA